MKKSNFLVKNKALFLLFGLGLSSFVFYSCTTNNEIKVEQPKKDPKPGGSGQSSTETQQPKIDQNTQKSFEDKINTAYSTFEASSSQTSYQNLAKTLDEVKSSLSQLFKNEDLEKKQIDWDSAKKTLDFQLEKTNYQTDNLTKLIIGSFLDILKPIEKTRELPRPSQPEIPEDRVNKYYEQLNTVAPKGQNWAIVKDGKRTVEDQYQYDFPDNEWRYYLEKYGGGGAKVLGLDDPDGLSDYPLGKTKKVASNLKSTLDDQAKKANQPLYDNASQRTFVLPKYDSSGKITGIDIPEHHKGDTSPAIHLDPQTGQVLRGGPGRVGLPRILPNQEYKKLTKSAISVAFRNGQFLRTHNGKEGEPDYLPPNEIVHFNNLHRGTLNIIDYKKEDNNKYPLTWYFITNAHVLNRLQVANDYHEGKIYGRDDDAYNTHNRQYNTWSLVFTKIKNSVSLNNIMPTTGEPRHESYYDTVNLTVRTKDTNVHNAGKKLESSRNFAVIDDQLNNNQAVPKDAELNVRTIVFGSNVFDKKLGDFTNQEKYKNMQELLDFAIMEVTFDNEEQAKTITKDWYDEHQDQKTNDKSTAITSDADFLQNDQYEKLPANQFYGLGFPLTEAETNQTLNEFKNKNAWESRKHSVSPYVNKDNGLYFNQDPSSEQWKNGGDLSWSRSYRSFMNKPGLTDIFIAMPYVSNGFIKITKFDSSKNVFSHTPYLFWGLGTLLDNFTGGGGMSGTGIYKDNKLYSLVFATDPRASTAVSLNLRSYGNDYKGYYGTYNLPKYDLIYGSKHQRKSYFQAMQELYKDKGIKTYLFPNGFDDSQKVDVFGDWNS
ncbi:Ig-specific serine endopeptidase MIP [Mesomycoplasma ovipneumoniae]|uniref:Ig-specific serine endopeptidase MIP n=1 Tax=Mesomycoplasma ovipneumoniae TaxID=29562 RepID=UPI002964B7AD|nr:DUF31 family protein [Mesomycoplasma ovipneumoniae]MDW2912180.1 DUF31 family protein [Mesomycoplasma ovipneumoniae]MDW2917221.1 DUF31 family protein [Mesomycoplasma ovipneumoniae]MDW2925780.1 DUF31 family protein [Mesomycoplasma ovipneumoniae]MDW2927150.1 DUF31 family protein [Mesomycoplasma ovipneumoniae]